MMKKNLIFFIIILCMPLHAQINKNGIPFIKNFTPNDYGASEQNWAICEDIEELFMLEITMMGILEFDGNTWEKYLFLMVQLLDHCIF